MRPHTLGMVGKGHKVAGERNGMHRLEAWAVKELRRRRLGNMVDDCTYAEIAANWGVAESTIRRAVQRKTWRRVR